MKPISYIVFITLLILTFGKRSAGSSDVSEQVTQDKLEIYMVSEAPGLNYTYVYSSTEGGRILYISGTGFDATASNNRVTLGPFPCTVISSTNELISCITTPWVAGVVKSFWQNLPINVTVGGRTVSCDNYQSCKFYYNEGNTPLLQHVEPRSMVSGSNVSFWGVHKAWNFSQVYNMKIGDFVCTPYNTTLLDINSLNTTNSTNSTSSTTSGALDNRSNKTNATTYYPWSYSPLNCTSDAFQTAGLYNISEWTNYGYASKVGASIFSVQQGKPYDIMVVPTITSLSDGSGSSEASFLTIKGSGFGVQKNNVDVEVAGTKCAVTKISTTELTCMARPSVSSTVVKANQGRITTNSTLNQTGGFISGSGLRFTKWTNLSQLQNKTPQQAIDLINSGVLKHVQTGTLHELAINSTDNNVLYHIKGYFKPVASGVHSFRAMSNSMLFMYVSAVKGSSSISHMNYSDPVINYNKSREGYPEADVTLNDLPQNLTSRNFTMTAGDYYYFQTIFVTNHYNFSSMKIEVRTPNSNINAPGQVPEIQQISVLPVNDPDITKFVQTGANNGTMSMNLMITSTWNLAQPWYNRTANFTWNATAEQFKKAISIFDYDKYGISVTRQVFDMYDADVTVSGQPPFKFVWTVTIDKYRAEVYNQTYNIINMTLNGSNLNNINDSTITPTWEMQPVQIHSPPMTGTYKMALDNVLVHTYNETMSANQVIDPYYFNLNLWMMPQYMTQYIKNAWGCKDVSTFTNETWMPENGFTFSISLSGCYGQPQNLPLIQIDSSNLTGGRDGTTPEATVVRLQSGSSDLIVKPVTSEFLFSVAEQPQVSMVVNGIPSACLGNCTFNYTTTMPIVNSASYSSSGVLSVTLSYPTAMTLKTSDFSILFDDTNCTKVTGSQSSLNCTMPKNPDGTPRVRAGDLYPMVVINKVGAAKLASTVSAISVPLTLSNYTPTVKLGKAGGQFVLIRGRGFPFEASDLLNVTICGTRARVTFTNNTMINATLPACTTDSTTIIVSYSTKTANIAFSYDPSVVPPTISSISPSSASPALKGSMIIIGAGFGSDKGTLSAWLLLDGVKKYQLNVLKVNDTNMTVKLPGGLPGTFTVQVIRNGYGVSTAASSTANVFKYEIAITGVSPATGSVGGGTVLTISGRNFSPDLYENQAYIGNAMNWFCQILTATPTSLTCRTPPINPAYTTLSQPVAVTSRITYEATCQGTCVFTYDNTTYPTVNAPLSTSLTANTAVTLTGTGFMSGIAGPIVRVGDQDVTPTSANDTEISFNYPALAAGDHQLLVFIDNVGYALPPITTQTYNSVTGLQSSGGSTEGHVLSITGNALLPRTHNDFNLDISLGSNADIKIPFTIVEDTPTILKFRILTFEQSAQTYTIQYCQYTYTYTSYDAETPIFTIPAGRIVTYDAATPLSITFDRPNATVDVSTVSAIPINGLGEQIGQELLLPITSIDSIVSTFTVNAASLTAGKWRFAIFCQQFGFAKVDTFEINYATQPTSATVVSSFAGGNIFTVTGSGLNNVSTLLVDGDPADLVSFTPFQLEYRIPPYTPRMSVNRYNIAKRTVAVGTVFADNPFKQQNIKDNKFSTVYESSATECFVGWDFGATYKKNLFRIAYHINRRFAQPLQFLGARFEGSNDNVTYTPIFEIGGNVTRGWNNWRTNQPLSSIYRYIRFAHNSSSACKLTEVRLFDGIFSTVGNGSTSYKVDVQFSNGMQMSNWTQRVDYRLNATPNVTSVNKLVVAPKGGESLTITGTNFGTVVANVKVTIDGINCAVTTVTNTVINCTVGQKLTITPETGFEVSVESRRAIVVCRNVTYAFRWSDPDTWSGDFPPIEDDAVYVPAGMTLLVDISTPKLKIIIVEGTLAFADQGEYTLQSESIMINYGRFQIGTEDYPYQNKLNITLHGGYYSRQLPIFGNKFIGCHACVFDIHGKIRNRTWTQLSETIPIGSTTVKLTEAVDWQVGEAIFVASTNFDYKEAERRVISAIDSTRTQITVEDPFVFAHISQSQIVGNNTIRVRAEVGLLSRNVYISGTEDSTTSQYGAHVMLHGTTEEGMIARIEFAEFSLCGQGKVVDRHCLLFKQNGDLDGSYVRGNSLHDSFSSLVVVQESGNLPIVNNVGFKSRSHGIYLETGGEMGNTIENNLIASTEPSWYVLELPTSFLLKHPFNVLKGNRAAGSAAYGIQFLLPNKAEGMAADLQICPSGSPLGEVHNNTVHSNTRTGFRIEKLVSRVKSCEAFSDVLSNPPIRNTIHKLTAYKNSDKAVLLQELGQTTISDITILDVGNTGIMILNTDYQPGNVTLNNSLIVGKTNMNSLTTQTNYQQVALGTPNSPNFYVNNTAFYNFAQGSALFSPYMSLFLPSPEVPKTDYVMTFFRNITFGNIQGAYARWTGIQRELYEDLDGSLAKAFFNAASVQSNYSRSTLFMLQPHSISPPNCFGNSSTWPQTVLCDRDVRPHVYFITNAMPDHDWYMPMIEEVNASSNTNSTQQSYIYWSKSEMSGTNWLFVLGSGKTYRMGLLNGLNWLSLEIPVPRYLSSSQPAVIMRFNYTDSRELYEIAVSVPGAASTPLLTQSAAPLNATSCLVGQFYQSHPDRYLDVCVTNKLSSTENAPEGTRILVLGIRCRDFCPRPIPVPDNNTNGGGGGSGGGDNYSPGGLVFVKEDFMRVWSNKTQWPTGEIPAAGENVTIPGEWNLLIDMDPNPINFFEIQGDVYVDERDTVIMAKSIWLRSGSFRAGNSTNPFGYKLDFIINGTSSDLPWAISPTYSGNKFFLVTGKLYLYGQPVGLTRSRLTQAAQSGSTLIKVEDASTWTVGDTLAMTPSFSNHTEYEKVKILSISGNDITLEQPLVNTYFGDVASTLSTPTDTFDMRGIVAHFNRSIRIISGETEQQWGFRTDVFSFNDGNITRTGRVILNYVEFVNGGQRETTGAALSFTDASVAEYNSTVEGCTFWNCGSYCIRLKSPNITFDNNNFVGGRKYIFFAESSASIYNFTNNLMVGAVSRASASSEAVGCFAQPSGVTFTGKQWVKDNICAGSSGAGFIVPYEPCGYEPENVTFRDNVASGCRIGFLYTVQKTDTCLQATKVKVHSSYFGILGNPTSTPTIKYANLMLADNVVSLSLRNGQGNSTDNNTAYVEDCNFYGVARPDCTYCYASPTMCTNSTAVKLLATTQSGTPFYSVRDNMLMDSITYDNKFAPLDSKTYITRTNFNNFAGSFTGLTCSSVVAFRRNSDALENVASTYMTSTVCNNCTQQGFAYFEPAPPAQQTSLGCGNISCTGPNNYIIVDFSGQFLGMNGTLLANNTNIGSNEATCNAVPDMNGHLCNRTDFGILQYESVSRDYNTRVVWPVELFYTGGTWTTLTNAWREWEWSGTEPLNKRMGRFISTLVFSKVYNLTFGAQPPSELKFQFQNRTDGGVETEYAVFYIYYPVANFISVSAKGQKVTPLLATDSTELSTLSTTCGANKYFYDNGTVAFVLTSNCQVRLSVTNNVQISARIQTTLPEFFANGGVTKFVDRMCAYLNITTDRLKVVGVYTGSAVVDYVIIDSLSAQGQESTSASSDQQTASHNELSTIAQAVQQAASTNMDIGGLGPIISATTVVNVVNTDGTSYIPPVVTPTNQTTSIAMIIGIAFGGMVVLIGTIVGIIFLVKKFGGRPIQTIQPEVIQLGLEKEGNVALPADLMDNSSNINMFEGTMNNLNVHEDTRRKMRIRQAV